MRAVLVSLLVAACATTMTPPPERVAGCWIERGPHTATMRWLPDPARGGALVGALLVYSATTVLRATRYALTADGPSWELCELGSAGDVTQCWGVAQGEGGSLAGGRAFIDQSGGRLRIAIVGDGSERVIFQGQRDGCD